MNALRPHREPEPHPTPPPIGSEEDDGLDALKGAARSLGFRSIGVARAGRSPHADRFLAWLDAGHHGSMDYLARKVERRIDPRETLQGAQSVVVVSMPYADDVDFPTDGEPDRGRIARYARGRDYHRVMEKRLKRLSAVIRDEARFRTWYTVDAGPLLERDWAEAAGIGWLGKNALIIDPEIGSWFFLGVILTDRLYPADPAIADQCGRCTRCLDACPTGALATARTVDAQKCISYLTIERSEPLTAEAGASLEGWVLGCDICQEVCPWNTRPARVSPVIDPDFAPRALPDSLETLGSLDRSSFLEHFSGTAIVRAGAERLAENARAVARAQRGRGS